MNDVTQFLPTLPAMTQRSIDVVRDFEAIVSQKPQIELCIRHFIHAGMYARSLTIPARAEITGALIKIETILIVSGDCAVYIGDEFKHVQGYNVFACAANRKQYFVARAPTDLTMLFPTDKNDVKKAEEQFTDEWRLLTTRNGEV